MAEITGHILYRTNNWRSSDSCCGSSNACLTWVTSLRKNKLRLKRFALKTLFWNANVSLWETWWRKRITFCKFANRIHQQWNYWMSAGCCFACLLCSILIQMKIKWHFPRLVYKQNRIWDCIKAIPLVGRNYHVHGSRLQEKMIRRELKGKTAIIICLLKSVQITHCLWTSISTKTLSALMSHPCFSKKQKRQHWTDLSLMLLLRVVFVLIWLPDIM